MSAARGWRGGVRAGGADARRRARARDRPVRAHPRPPPAPPARERSAVQQAGAVSRGPGRWGREGVRLEAGSAVPLGVRGRAVGRLDPARPGTAGWLFFQRPPWPRAGPALPAVWACPAESGVLVGVNRKKNVCLCRELSSACSSSCVMPLAKSTAQRTSFKNVHLGEGCKCFLSSSSGFVVSAESIVLSRLGTDGSLLK